MTENTKISFTVGNLQFSGEGSSMWLEKQLDKLLEKVGANSIGAIQHTSEDDERDTKDFNKITNKSLAAFLSDRNAKTTQTRKFLATAAYLQAKGQKPIATSDVTRALKDANQGRLGNPSDTLNQNIAKGFCERDGKGFFVTDDGFGELGLE